MGVFGGVVLKGTKKDAKKDANHFKGPPCVCHFLPPLPTVQRLPTPIQTGCNSRLTFLSEREMETAHFAPPSGWHRITAVVSLGVFHLLNLCISWFLRVV